MTYIGDLRRLRPIGTRKRIAGHLRDVKKQLVKQGVPPRSVQDTLLLASWNIRDFDSNKFGHGKRLRESYFYIAEIISAFDIVALQEVNADMSGLHRLMRHLGPAWEFIATDPAGNNERMAFVYDRNKVWFRNIAGEIVLKYKTSNPTKKEIQDFAKKTKGLSQKEFKKLLEERNALDPNRQFNRTPFMVAFQSGWFKFKLSTVHIYYGAESGLKLERRKREIREIAKFLRKRADKEKEDHYILLGDFNIVSPGHETMKALTDNGFMVPKQLEKTNVKQTKFYDQIAFRLQKKGLMPQAANVFRFKRAVFKDGEFDTYRTAMKRISSSAKGMSPQKLRKYYKEWRTFQMSDHDLMWVELKIDFSDDYLKDRLLDR